MSIYELMSKLPPIVETAIHCFSKNQILFPVKDSTYCLQMVWYWWHRADVQLTEETKDDIVESSRVEEGKGILKSPTLISTSEQIEYLITQLNELVKETEQYLGEASISPEIHYKVSRGYDRLMEALFNIETAKSHYAEVTRKR